MPKRVTFRTLELSYSPVGEIYRHLTTCIQQCVVQLTCLTGTLLLIGQQSHEFTFNYPPNRDSRFKCNGRIFYYCDG